MKRMKIWLGPVLFLTAAVCLVLGLFLPIIRFDTLYFFEETPSLIELVDALFRDGDIALSLVVGLFSIAFPVVKLAGIGLQLWGRGGENGFLRRVMPHLSKWSMMDVMLVAIVVFAAKSSGLASAVSQPGLWFYAASTLIAGLLPALVSAPAEEPPAA
ncbi:paraquat-inducible protein A [Rhizobium sp. XQZ8]|uniref:paraquat-inducible protein A n=1 Tax=Rhizobium populisoli TaxID=2859785 RepID=UPI001C6692FB|nr:paraquat-inducible protein A [Rhizobium populisoli]MBW6421398.1 paraquat-inducible protein A [Rhizobium populisoli]